MSLSQAHVVSGAATDEEHDDAEAERESLPVIGTSRPACSPGPRPLSRAVQLLIEGPPGPRQGCPSLARFSPHQRRALAKKAFPPASEVASGCRARLPSASHSRAGLATAHACAWRLGRALTWPRKYRRALRERKTPKEVRIGLTNEARSLEHAQHWREEGRSGDPLSDLRCATPSGAGGIMLTASPSHIIILTVVVLRKNQSSSLLPQAMRVSHRRLSRPAGSEGFALSPNRYDR